MFPIQYFLYAKKNSDAISKSNRIGVAAGVNSYFLRLLLTSNLGLHRVKFVSHIAEPLYHRGLNPTE